MIAVLRPYPSSRYSTIPWLGDVPEHWAVRRLKYVLRERDARSEDGREQLLRVSQYTGVTERKASDESGDSANSRAESLVGYKRVEPDELVVNIMLAWNGSLGISQYTGITSPAYCVYRFGRDGQPWYFHYLLRSPLYRARIKALSTGVVDSRLRLYSDDLYGLPVPLPPVAEQAGIVRFLAHADRRIRHAIRAKQKLIALLNEQKEAVIHRAVTRGLDPDVRLKPSGVDWLGDVPEHWETRRIRECIADKRAGLWGEEPTPANAEDHIVCIRVADFDMERLRVGTSKLTTRAVPHDLAKTRLLAPGDVLIEKSGGGDVTPVGRAVLYDLPEAAISSNFVTRVRPEQTVIHPEWLLAVLAVLQATRRNVPFIKQTTGIQNLNEAAYFGLRMGVPPLNEQASILGHLRKFDESQKAILAKAHREIDLLREYWTRLDSDVVTGKLDVREAAARLPDEPEWEPLDEIDVEQTEEPGLDWLVPGEA